MEFFQNLNPVIAALVGTAFTYLLTALGAGLVFGFKTINHKILNAMLGFSAGVMIAASFWSLLSPSIDLASELGMIPWVPAVIGFLSGGAFLMLVDRLLPHMHIESHHKEGLSSSWKRSVLLVLAITLHNIPEGLAVGVAFGAAAAGLPGASIGAAIALALGIGIQNFPEGAAVSVPLRREGMSVGKSFMIGQYSGIVEPIAGVLGALLAISMRNFLPYALSFAAGAMIYVVVEELIPESQMMKTTKIATIGAMLGFAVMMLLDVALG
ncbi:MAG: ZIP family metal transporter [Bacilli bacterium]|nr:ZIP family metal transporter [Bacilli bacterium]MBN2876505.1 ZIP family metal transporter [Bacilli bacterium]